MNNFIIINSKKIASFLRRLGMIIILEMVIDSIDSIFVKLNHPPLQIKISDFKLFGYLRHIRYLRILLSNEHESYSLKLCQQHLNNGAIFIDGGAHIGLYSLYASRWVGDHGSVFSFEPDSYNRKTLQYNLSKNQCSNVLVIPKALSNQVETRDFYQGKTTLSSSLLNRKDIEQHGKITVLCTTLDHEFADKMDFLADKTVFMKLDLEGAEPLALQGMEHLFNRVQTVGMLIETNPKALSNAGFSPTDISNFLIKQGFVLQYVDDEEEQLIPFGSGIKNLRDFKGNLFCVKGNL